MPGKDGIEFLQAVRETYPDLPFVLFTSEGSEAVASDAISAEVTDHLQKQSGTVQYELLVNRIRNAVQARREGERADRKHESMRLTEVLGDTGGFELDAETGDVRMTDTVGHKRGHRSVVCSVGNRPVTAYFRCACSRTCVRQYDGTRRILHLPEQANPDFEKNLQQYHPDDRENIRQPIQQALNTGEQTRETFRYRHSDVAKQQLLAGVVLFGSVARGDADRASDIDVLVVVEESKTHGRRVANAVAREVEGERFDGDRYEFEPLVETTESAKRVGETLPC